MQILPTVHLALHRFYGQGQHLQMGFLKNPSTALKTFFDLLLIPSFLLLIKYKVNACIFFRRGNLIQKLNYICPPFAGVVKLVDTLDLGSSALRLGGSSPFTRTKKNLNLC